MIEVQGLTRRYGDFTAVEDIGFSVGDGEILGMLGPNGAGKTTTIRMITGFLPPSWGQVTVAGHDLLENPRAARREIGYLPENVALYPEMRVNEYLAYRARLEGLSRKEANEAIGESVERCLLEDVKSQIIGTLSKGYRQRVGLASAILHGPKVLVLDEPTVGLDPRQIVKIRELILELGRERTLLISTHILPEVELLCDRVVIIDGGKIVEEGSPENLRSRWSGSFRLEVAFKEAGGDVEGALSMLPGLLGVERDPKDPNRFFVDAVGESEPDPREVVYAAAVANGWVLLEMIPRRVSLEDVFVRLITENEEGAMSDVEADASENEETPEEAVS